MMTKARKAIRGRKRPPGGLSHTQTPSHKSENANSERHSDFSKQTWDLSPDFRVNCNSHAMTAILLLLGSARAQISPWWLPAVKGGKLRI